MSCDFRVFKLSDDFSEVNFCDGSNCGYCDRVEKEIESYLSDKKEHYRSIYDGERHYTVGISPTPDYLDYWKSAEGLGQIVQGLFRGEVQNIDDVMILVSFWFKRIKGFTIPIFCFELQLFGSEESLIRIDKELTVWSPRICGWLHDSNEPYLVELLERCDYGFEVFKDFLTKKEFEFLNELTLLSPIHMKWNDFMRLSEIGIFRNVMK